MRFERLMESTSTSVVEFGQVTWSQLALEPVPMEGAGEFNAQTNCDFLKCGVLTVEQQSQCEYRTSKPNCQAKLVSSATSIEILESPCLARFGSVRLYVIAVCGG